jgi:hypothetical protein
MQNLSDVERESAVAWLKGLARWNAKPFDIVDKFGKTQMQAGAGEIAPMKLAMLDTSLKAAILKCGSFHAAAFP